jgi:hypothetical protein
MPATSIRDLVIHDDDIVVGTHGRGFWILDDMTPIRQLAPPNRIQPRMAPSPATVAAILFQPRATYRFRRDKNTDTPLPPEEPVGRNPPNGVIINYYLGPRAHAPVLLEILDGEGKLVRKFSSSDPVDTIPRDLNVPTYWLRPPQIVSAAPGAHRFVWDMHYPPPAGVDFGYPISAIPGDTPREPLGPAVLPGNYTARLTVNGNSQTQRFVVKMDPRVKMTRADLEQQFDLGLRMAQITWNAAPAIAEVRRFRAGLRERLAKGGPSDLRTSLTSIEQQAAEFDNPSAAAAATSSNSLVRLNSQAASLLDRFESADMPPSTQSVAAAREVSATATRVLAAYGRFRKTDLTTINNKLRAAGLTPIEIGR